VASAEARAKLARAASALNVSAPQLPALILMTDAKRLPDPIAAACALPKGSAIVVRHVRASARAELAAALAPIARDRGLRLLVANDAALADRLGADGLHLSEAHAREAAHWRARRPHWLVTAAAHSANAVATAAAADAHAVLLSPVFATKSQPGREPLGPLTVRAIAQTAGVAVYALGGIDCDNVAQLAGARLAGIAAIGALTPD